jgi:1,4-alpha-glucan branching enzyme
MAAPVVEAKSKPLTRRVPIVVKIQGAKEVAVTGDFTGWKEDGIKLIKATTGEWRTTVDLAPGEYQYRLRVDGVWKNHDEAKKRVPNPYGSENCVLVVT